MTVIRRVREAVMGGGDPGGRDVDASRPAAVDRIRRCGSFRDGMVAANICASADVDDVRQTLGTRLRPPGQESVEGSHARQVVTYLPIGANLAGTNSSEDGVRHASVSGSHVSLVDPLRGDPGTHEDSF